MVSGRREKVAETLRRRGFWCKWLLFALMLLLFTSASNTTAIVQKESDDIVHYDAGIPSTRYAWRPANQENVINPLGGDNLNGQVSSKSGDGAESVDVNDSEFAEKSKLKFTTEEYPELLNPAYQIGKYAEQTPTNGRYNVTLNVAGNTKSNASNQSLDIVFVVDLSGSMEEVEWGNSSHKYQYVDEQNNKFVRSAYSARNYFNGDVVSNHSKGGVKYKQFINEKYANYKANASIPKPAVTDYRFLGSDGSWYAYTGNSANSFVKIADLTGPIQNQDYDKTVRAEHVRDGINRAMKTLVEMADDKSVSVGLIGFSARDFANNNTQVPLSNLNSSQQEKINAALDDDFSGGTWTQNGLARGAEMLQQSPDPNAKKVLVLLTDGRPTYAGAHSEIGDGSDKGSPKVWEETINSASEIKNQDIHIQGISVDTPEQDINNFQQLTSFDEDTDSYDYQPVSNGEAIANTLIDDVKYDFEKYHAANSIKDGVIVDPLGSQYRYVKDATSVVTSTGKNALSDLQLKLIKKQVDSQLAAADSSGLTIKGINLGNGQSVKITYQVQLQTDSGNFVPNKWYPMNGVTTLTPSKEAKPVKFGVPAGRSQGTNIVVAKKWHDLESAKRPDLIHFIVKQQKKVQGEWVDTDWQATGTLTKKMNWQGTFDRLVRNGHLVALPRYADDGQEFSYKVVGEVQDSALTNAGYHLLSSEGNVLVNQQCLLNVQKYASGSLAGAATLKGAEFTLSDGKTEQVITDDNQFGYLHPGTFTIWESKAPDGYAVDNQRFTFAVDNQGDVTTAGHSLGNLPEKGQLTDGLYRNQNLSTNDGPAVVTLVKTDLIDTPPTNLVINKIDAATGKPVGGAQFSVTDLKLDVDETKGTFTSTNLEPGKQYVVSETTAPSGYVKLPDEMQVVVTNSGTVNIAVDGKTVSLSDDGHNVMVTDDVHAKLATDGAHHRTIVLTVANHHKGILPHTGTKGLMRLLFASVTVLLIGVVLVLMTILNRQKEEKV